MAPTITLAQLVERRACSEQVAKFKRLFGESVEVTEALAVQHAAAFDWNWAADNLLSALALVEYYARITATAMAKYERVTATAMAEYERVTAPARAEYYARITAPALAEYERVMAPARAEYERVTATARAEYERVTATAFANLYIKENQ